jgi:hypothetical protein
VQVPPPLCWAFTHLDCLRLTTYTSRSRLEVEDSIFDWRGEGQGRAVIVDGRTPERAAAALRWMPNGERENKRKERETL